MPLYRLGGNTTFLQLPRSVKHGYSSSHLQIPCYEDVSQPLLVVIVGACGLASNIFGLLLFHGVLVFPSPTSPYSLSIFQNTVTLIHTSTPTATKRPVIHPFHMRRPLSPITCPCRTYMSGIAQDLTPPCTDTRPLLELQLRKLRKTWPQLPQVNTNETLRHHHTQYAWNETAPSKYMLPKLLVLITSKTSLNPPRCRHFLPITLMVILIICAL